jgi:hypothetical protein
MPAMEGVMGRTHRTPCNVVVEAQLLRQHLLVAPRRHLGARLVLIALAVAVSLALGFMLATALSQQLS